MPKGEEEFARRSRLIKRINRQIRAQEIKSKRAMPKMSGEDFAKGRGKIRKAELIFKRFEENIRKQSKRKNISNKKIIEGLKRLGDTKEQLKIGRKAAAINIKFRRESLKGVKKFFEAVTGKEVTTKKIREGMSKASRFGKRIGDLLKRKSILKKTFPLKFKGGVLIPKKLLKKRFVKREGA